MSQNHRLHFADAGSLVPDIQVEIYWCNLSSCPDGLLLDSFDGFANQLRENYPELPIPTFSPLPAQLVDQLPAYLLARLPGSVDDGSFACLRDRMIFVLCDGDEDFAFAYQQENELAHWGVAIPCSFAIAWEPSKYLIWHETLHLMNAKDCYNKFGINKCPNPRCIMRRAPARNTCGEHLTLCSKNVKRIRRFASEFEFRQTEALTRNESGTARADRRIAS